MKRYLAFGIGAMMPLLFGKVCLAEIALPNPASQLCNTLGGASKVYKTTEGDELSLCAFKDSTYLYGLIGEWTLFQYKTNRDNISQGVTAFLNHQEYVPPSESGVGHPALRYCLQVGGKRIILTEANGDESGLCVFDDGTQIEEWTLFRGPEVHKALTSVL